MQLILDTVPVLREEDRQDLLQVTPRLLADLRAGPSHLHHKPVVLPVLSNYHSRTLEMFCCCSFPGDAFIRQPWVESEKALPWFAARSGFSRWNDSIEALKSQDVWEGRFARLMQHLEKPKACWNKLGRILAKICHLIFFTSSLSCGLPGTYLDLQPHGQVDGRGSLVSPLPPAVLLPGGRAHVPASVPHRGWTGGQPHHWAEP